MEGQARVAGQVYKDVEIGGKTYRINKPNLVGFYGEVEAWIIARKTDPLVLAVRACKMAPAAMHASIWEAAMKTASSARIASQDELSLFWGSRWSNAFLFMKSLDDKHREDVPNAEAAMLVLDESVDIDELLANISVVNGDADIKNSSGLSGTQAPQSQPMEIQPTEGGQDSIVILQSDTVGPQSK